MKKILMIFVIMLGVLSVQASDLFKIQYKNIEDECKIKYENGVWKDKVSKKDLEYFLKIKEDDNLSNLSNFYRNDGSFAFSTGCQYEFLNAGSLIGYSNSEMKFYEFTFDNNNLNKRELTKDEVQEIFPEYKIVLISEFSNNTNSLKVKKDAYNFKLLLLNDTDRNFDNYSFTSGNSKIEKSELLGLINVKSKGMLQFSRFGDNTKDSPWFILLVR